MIAAAMRKFLVLLALAALSCTTTGPAPAPPAVEGTHGLITEEEARILALEDRREFDAGLTAEWATHTNPLHRIRIATAMGRIGPHTFADANGNGERDGGERQAGVDRLIAMAADEEPSVRTAVAFALGEIGDKS